MTRLAFIGGGNMARSLIGGLLKTGVAPATISVAEPLAEARHALGREFGVACFVAAGGGVDDDPLLRAGASMIISKPVDVDAVLLQARFLVAR